MSIKGLPCYLNFVKEALFTRYSVYILEIDSNGQLYIYSHMYFHPFYTILYFIYCRYYF